MLCPVKKKQSPNTSHELCCKSFPVCHEVSIPLQVKPDPDISAEDLDAIAVLWPFLESMSQLQVHQLFFSVCVSTTGWTSLCLKQCVPTMVWFMSFSLHQTCKVAVRAELVRTKGDVAAAKTLLVSWINIHTSGCQSGCHTFVSIHRGTCFIIGSCTHGQAGKNYFLVAMLRESWRRENNKSFDIICLRSLRACSVS